MAKKLFKYVLFNSKNGNIISELSPSKDTVRVDINNTGAIELDIPFYSLTNAQRKDINNFFDPINRSIALMRVNELGETIGVVTAGFILQREFNVESQSVYIQTMDMAGYLAKIPVFWMTGETKTKPQQVKYKGTPYDLYNMVLFQGLQNYDGVSTIENWRARLSSADTRQATIDFNMADFYTVQDAVEEIRDELFEGKSPEIRFDPVYNLEENKIMWIFRTSDDSDNPQITDGKTVLEIDANPTSTVAEILSYEVNEESDDLYNFLTIDASESSGDIETYFIKSKNQTPSGKLTLFNSFETGVNLSSAQMDAQLSSRLKNTDIPEKTATLRVGNPRNPWDFIGFNFMESIFDDVVRSNKVLGRFIKVKANSKMSGLGVTLRCTEVTFSTVDYDINISLTLQNVANTYPSLPAQRKIDKKKPAKRSSLKKRDKDSKRYKKNIITKGKGTTIDGGDGNFEWDGTDSGISTDPVGGTDTPNKPELEPDRLDIPEPSDWTIGSVWNSWYAKYQSPSNYEQESPFFKWKDGLYYTIGNEIDYDRPSQKIKLNFQALQLDQLSEDGAVKKSTNDNSTIGSISKIIEMISINEIMDLAPGRFPETFKAYTQAWNTSEPKDVREDTIYTNWKTNIYRFCNFYCFVINGRFYGHLIIEGKENDQYSYLKTTIHSEVFFTADLSDDLTSLSNYTLLTSPAQQIWGSKGQYKIISLNSLEHTYRSRNNFNQKGVYLNFNTPYYDLSDNNSKLIFPHTDFIFSRKYLDMTGTSGVPKGFLQWATEEDYGISYSEMNTEFGLVEADFTSKQPVFKNSSHQLPYPRQNQHPTLGTIYNKDWQPTLSNIWNGNYSYTALNTFKPLFLINNNGVYLTLASEIGQGTLNTFFEGEEAGSFSKKYMNKIWTLKEDGGWAKFDIGSSYDLSNQPAIWGQVMPDGKVIHSLQYKDGKLVVKSGDKYQKVESKPEFINTINEQYPYSFKVGAYWDYFLPSSDSPSSIFVMPERSYYRMIGNFKESKYKIEVTKIPYNKSISILKSKDYFLNNPIWERTESIKDYNIFYNLGLNNGDGKLNPESRFFPYYSEAQRRITGINIDFKEFASWGGCNVGIDSNGELWQWGIKFQYNVVASSSNPTGGIWTNPTLTNKKPVKIQLPWKIKKINIRGDYQSSFYRGSINKRIIGITEDGKPFCLGFFGGSNSSPTYIEAKLLNVSGGVKIDDIAFARNNKGIYAVGEDKSLYCNELAYNQSSESLDLSKDFTSHEFTGKVKYISNIASQSNQTHMLLVTTDGKVWGTGSKWGQGEDLLNPKFSRIDSVSDKIKSAISVSSGTASSSIEVVFLINESGELLVGKKTLSNSDKWNNFTFNKYSLPENTRAEDFIYDQDYQDWSNTMLLCTFGGGLTQSKGVFSTQYFNTTTNSWDPDSIGAMRNDGWIYGSEVETGSLLPDLPFLTDGEGGEGQDWATNPWLPQTGDGTVPTPSENEVSDSEGGLIDKTIDRDIKEAETWGGAGGSSDF